MGVTTMAAVAALTVSNATRVGPADWVTPRDVFGPQLIPSPAPRGACVVQALTSPANSPAEWGQIAWAGGEPVPGRPNQRLVSRQDAGKATVGATIQGRGPQVTVWVLWAAINVQASGPRPSRAKSWAEGAAFTGGDACGAFVVNSFTMGENARGQVVAVAELAPAGVGRVISAAGLHGQFQFRRQVTAHDFVDGKRSAGKKAFVPWAADDSLPQLQTLDPGPDDRLYDTDGPDLPGGAARSAETYNNFRQWAEWGGAPCSNYGYWYWRARWKGQKVTLKDVGPGTIQLPPKPYYP
jgi:hypothetical protein